MKEGNLFWDSCIFINYLTGNQTSPHFNDICQYIADAKAKKCTIYFSTITFAEIRQEFLKQHHGKTSEFFEDLGGAFVPIEPNPNILINVGELRSAKSTNPGDPNPPKQRSIATPDAIILETCIYAKEVLGLKDITLHSTDEGKGKNWAGRCVPIIGFEKWYPETTRTARVSKVCSLIKSHPNHPSPLLIPHNADIIQGNFNKTN